MSSSKRKQQIEALLAEDPSDSFLRYGLAMEYASEGNEEEALKQLQDLINQDASYVPAYLQAGQLLMKLDREKEAIATYRLGIAKAKEMGDDHAAGEMERFLDAIL